MHNMRVRVSFSHISPNINQSGRVLRENLGELLRKKYEMGKHAGQREDQDL